MPIVKVEAKFWVAEALGAEEGTLLLEEEVVEGSSLASLLSCLSAQNQLFARTVYDPEEGHLSEHVMLILNDRHVDLLEGLETKLGDGDTLLLLPAFSGG